MSALVVGLPVPEGLDPNRFRVRVVVDLIDGAALTPEDLARIDAVYPSKPAKRHAPAAVKPKRKRSACRDGRHGPSLSVTFPTFTSSPNDLRSPSPSTTP